MSVAAHLSWCFRFFGWAQIHYSHSLRGGVIQTPSPSRRHFAAAHAHSRRWASRAARTDSRAAGWLQLPDVGAGWRTRASNGGGGGAAEVGACVPVWYTGTDLGAGKTARLPFFRPQMRIFFLTCYTKKLLLSSAQLSVVYFVRFWLTLPQETKGNLLWVVIGC